MIQNKILSLIGLATKAGKTVSGEFSTEKAVKQGTACLVLVSEEASANTKKKFQDKCSYYEVPIFIYGTKQELGNAMGKEFRASMAVTDPGLSDAIAKLLKKSDGGSEYVENESV
ncbi:MAG: ribosomal L7Ae/L30e/S12e/Gadd45 family protein [Eubacteriales bacterium]|nr:ribosomal L7Ae/L30e/S12e/Gadd45 family protein [Eubacteriales bacterium]